ncbi:MAG: GNAT family N-acetyltransferase [Allorhizobium sp.]
MDDSIAIAVVADKDAAFEAATLAMLDDTAVALGKPFDGGFVQIRADDGAGQLIGGLVAEEMQGWLYVKYLAVGPLVRGRGIGAKLLAQAEREALKLGLVGVYLSTFSFQAPRFYQRQGYSEIGRLQAINGKPECIWFAKTFETGR